MPYFLDADLRTDLIFSHLIIVLLFDPVSHFGILRDQMPAWQRQATTDSAESNVEFHNKYYATFCKPLEYL